MTSRYLAEILEQPAALRRSAEGFPSHDTPLMGLASRLRRGEFRRVILTGMGSSLYACYPLWLALCRAGIPAMLWDASELLHYGREALAEDTLLIAVSQSGESAEVRGLMEKGPRPGFAVGVTNGTENSLAAWADLTLDSQAGSEGATSTKTYTTSLAVLHLLGCELLGRDVAVAQAGVQATAEKLAAHLEGWQAAVGGLVAQLHPSESLTYIARGPGMATALTAFLITDEVCKLPCTGISAGLFRHGPLELARPGFRAVVLAGNDAVTRLNVRLAADIARAGGTVVLLTPRPEEAPPGVIRLALPDLPPDLLPLAEIVPIQLLTIPLAEARGYEPSVFQNCSKVTTEE